MAGTKLAAKEIFNRMEDLNQGQSHWKGSTHGGRRACCCSLLQIDNQRHTAQMDSSYRTERTTSVGIGVVGCLRGAAGRTPTPPDAGSIGFGLECNELIDCGH